MKKFLILFLGFFAVIISANAQQDSLNCLKDSKERITRTTKAQRTYLSEQDYFKKASWKEFKKKKNLPRGITYKKYILDYTEVHKYYPENVRKRNLFTLKNEKR